MHCYTQCPLYQATTNPHLCQRLLDTHGQVWVSLLWGHYSLLLVHTSFCLCPPRVCFPVLCKFWHLYDGLMATSSKRVYAKPRSTAPRAPVPAAVHCWPIPPQFSSVAQSYLTMWPHGLQHTRPPCPSSTPRVYSNSCPLSQWCHPTISSSVVPISSRLQSFPASGSFPMSQLFASGRQSIGASASALVLPRNFQDWFPLRWTGWCSL